MVRSHPGHRDHEMIDFSVLKEIRRGLSRAAFPDFQKAD